MVSLRWSSSWTSCRSLPAEIVFPVWVNPIRFDSMYFSEYAVYNILSSSSSEVQANYSFYFFSSDTHHNGLNTSMGEVCFSGYPCPLLTFTTLVKSRGQVLCLLQNAAWFTQHEAAGETHWRTPQGFSAGREIQFSSSLAEQFLQDKAGGMVKSGHSLYSTINMQKNYFWSEEKFNCFMYRNTWSLP